MRQRKTIAIAIACGVACAVCVALFMASVRGEAAAARNEMLARYGGEQVDVCVATRAISAGERIDSGMITTHSWIADLLPEGAVVDPSSVLGRTVTSPIAKGEVIVAMRFERAAEVLDVPAGKVAISVSAKTVQAVGGAIQPGMLVDVYATGDSGASVLAREVLVLDTSAAGGERTSSSGDIAWVTLAIDAANAQEFVTATSKATLHFVLPSSETRATEAAPASSSSTSASASSAASKSSASSPSKSSAAKSSTAVASSANASKEGA